MSVALRLGSLKPDGCNTLQRYSKGSGGDEQKDWECHPGQRMSEMPSQEGEPEAEF